MGTKNSSAQGKSEFQSLIAAEQASTCEEVEFLACPCIKKNIKKSLTSDNLRKELAKLQLREAQACSKIEIIKFQLKGL